MARLLLRALLLFNLGTAVVAHSRQEQDEIVPEDKRGELLAKWEQDVCTRAIHSSCQVLAADNGSTDSGVSRASQLLRICAVSNV